MFNKYSPILPNTYCAVVVMLALIVSSNAFADSDSESDSFKKLSAQWWQWALSIPTPENPMLDATGDKCVVGQNGSTWFLAGIFSGTTVTRNCSVPEGKELFFPIVNSVNINVPNVCGQGVDNVPITDLRTFSADLINTITKVSITVNGKPIEEAHRVRSKVFEVAFPENNVFDEVCASLGGVPAGIFSPAVDDGFYVKLKNLEVGNHILQFSAETASGVMQDVTYHLTVVPVLLK